MAFSSISHIYTLVFLLGQWCKPVVRSFRFCTHLKLCEFNCKCIRLSTVVLCLILSLLHNRLSAVTQYSAHSITVQYCAQFWLLLNLPNITVSPTAPTGSRLPGWPEVFIGLVLSILTILACICLCLFACCQCGCGKTN